MEDIQIAVESILRRCTVEELTKIAIEMRIAQDTVDGKTKREVMRAICEAIDGLQDDDQKMEIMKRMIPAAPKQTAKDLCDVLLGSDTDPHQQDQKDETVQLLKALSMNSASTFRRPCKISGTIGAEGDEGNLDYVSLCGKIEDARKNKYKDEEIAIAVRNIVSAGDLRSYLDARSDMGLRDMLKFIGGWRKEKSASEMHKLLEKEFQGPEEDTVKFAVRLMKLREKIGIAAAAEGSKRFEDKETLRDDFFHALRTGLRDSDTKARMGALITKGSTTSDNVIMEHLREISAEEEESKLKRGKNEGEVQGGARRVKINEISVPSTVNPVLVAVVNRLEKKMDSLNSELKVLRDEEEPSEGAVETPKANTPEWEFLNLVKRLESKVDGLSTEVAELRTSRRYGCEHCKKQGKGNSCQHCFFCGAGDHKVGVCPKKKQSNSH
jgi:hypothetical protein